MTRQRVLETNTLQFRRSNVWESQSSLSSCRQSSQPSTESERHLQIVAMGDGRHEKELLSTRAGDAGHQWRERIESSALDSRRG